MHGFLLDEIETGRVFLAHWSAGAHEMALYENRTSY